MTRVFIDTSFLLAIVLEPDEHHRRALAWRAHVAPSFLTTEFVLIEFLDALDQVQLRPRATLTVEALRSDAGVRVIPSGPQLFSDAFQLYKSRQDKRWSLTDCTSFVVMGREGITDALSSDHDFEQAGFRALLRTDPS